MEEKKREVDILMEVLAKHEQDEQQVNLKINESRKERDNMNNEKKKADTMLKKLGTSFFLIIILYFIFINFFFTTWGIVFFVVHVTCFFFVFCVLHGVLTPTKISFPMV
jgi:uncharacterized membrane protein